MSKLKRSLERSLKNWIRSRSCSNVFILADVELYINILLKKYYFVINTITVILGHVLYNIINVRIYLYNNIFLFIGCILLLCVSLFDIIVCVRYNVLLYYYYCYSMTPYATTATAVSTYIIIRHRRHSDTTIWLYYRQLLSLLLLFIIDISCDYNIYCSWVSIIFHFWSLSLMIEKYKTDFVERISPQSLQIATIFLRTLENMVVLRIAGFKANSYYLIT